MTKDKLDALRRESFRCTSDEKTSAQMEAKRRGMTFSQLVRLAVVQLVSRNPTDPDYAYSEVFAAPGPAMQDPHESNSENA